MYLLFIVTSCITYGICYYFGYREPIILTNERIAGLISGSLTYIVLGPLGFKYYDSLKK
jgi:hypothetical protein